MSISQKENEEIIPIPKPKEEPVLVAEEFKSKEVEFKIPVRKEQT